VAELEEKIKELKEQREAHNAERSKLEAERKECHEKSKQVDNEVDTITTDVEELRVCVCTCVVHNNYLIVKIYCSHRCSLPTPFHIAVVNRLKGREVLTVGRVVIA
jgi:hypothetical protein